MPGNRRNSRGLSQKGCRELKGLGTGSADDRFSLHLNSVELIGVTKKETAQLLFLLFVNEKRTSPFFEWNGYKESENKYIY